MPEDSREGSAEMLQKTNSTTTQNSTKKNEKYYEYITIMGILGIQPYQLQTYLSITASNHLFAT